jgi:hypothetical protein
VAERGPRPVGAGDDWKDVDLMPAKFEPEQDPVLAEPASDKACEAIRRFGTVGELPPGPWFIADRLEGRFSTDVSDGRWEHAVDDAPGWVAVGGPPVGATLGASCEAVGADGLPPWGETLRFWLEFDQEAHPFGRFDLSDLAIAYEDPGSGMRLYVPLPSVKDRTQLWMRSGANINACEAYIPGVISGVIRTGAL